MLWSACSCSGLISIGRRKVYCWCIEPSENNHIVGRRLENDRSRDWGYRWEHRRKAQAFQRARLACTKVWIVFTFHSYANMALIEIASIWNSVFFSIWSNALFTSNTSSLSIEKIAEPVNRKDKFGGLHFFNPVPLMKLLEVIRIPTTSNESYKALIDFGKSIGKTTVVCKVCQRSVSFGLFSLEKTFFVTRTRLVS